jgi:PPOX class probable F420-dependent enzyme
MAVFWLGGKVKRLLPNLPGIIGGVIVSYPLAILIGHNFISLTTFRKTGKGVPTPVWFTVVEDKVYVITNASSGKAKRIRNNPQVHVAPSDVQGKIIGERFTARAHILPQVENQRLETAFIEKYGIDQWRQFGLPVGSDLGKRVFIELDPDEES